MTPLLILPWRSYLLASTLAILVCFFEDPTFESLFSQLLAEHCKVDFMGIVKWFLGVNFSWRITSSTVAVHLNQSGFVTNLVKSFSRKTRNKTPTATLYWSGIPINSIAPSLDDDNSPAKLWCKDAYQSLIGSIRWLASTPHPNLLAVHSFLSSYSNKPAVSHMKHSMLFTTSTQPRVMEFHSPWMIWLPCTHTSTILCLLMLRHTPMPSHQNWVAHPLFLPVATPVGVPKLEVMSPMALLSHFSSVAAWATKLFSRMLAQSVGLVSGKNALLLAPVRLKFGLSMLHQRRSSFLQPVLECFGLGSYSAGYCFPDGPLQWQWGLC